MRSCPYSPAHIAATRWIVRLRWACWALSGGYRAAVFTGRANAETGHRTAVVRAFETFVQYRPSIALLGQRLMHSLHVVQSGYFISSIGVPAGNSRSVITVVTRNLGPYLGLMMEQFMPNWPIPAAFMAGRK